MENMVPVIVSAVTGAFALLGTIVTVVFQNRKTRQSHSDGHGELYGGLKELSDKIDANRRTHDAALREILAAQITTCHDKWATRKWIPPLIKEAEAAQFEIYEELGGNGFRAGMHREIQALPTREPQKKLKEV
jgi:hypothetical protein